EDVVHAGDGIADGHGTEGVTVIATARREQADLSVHALCLPVLQGGFDRDLDRDRAGVTEEDSVQPRRRDVDKAFGEAYGGFVREAAEHHVRHLSELVTHRGVETRMTISVQSRPPAR